MGPEVRDPTIWTVLQKNGPNHLGLSYNVLPAHQMALITSSCAPFSISSTLLGRTAGCRSLLEPLPDGGADGCHTVADWDFMDVISASLRDQRDGMQAAAEGGCHLFGAAGDQRLTPRGDPCRPVRRGCARQGPPAGGGRRQAGDNKDPRSATSASTSAFLVKRGGLMAHRGSFQAVPMEPPRDAKVNKMLHFPWPLHWPLHCLSLDLPLPLHCLSTDFPLTSSTPHRLSLPPSTASPSPRPTALQVGKAGCVVRSFSLTGRCGTKEMTQPLSAAIACHLFGCALVRRFSLPGRLAYSCSRGSPQGVAAAGRDSPALLAGRQDHAGGGPAVGGGRARKGCPGAAHLSLASALPCQ